jgi:hypothetical protein
MSSIDLGLAAGRTDFRPGEDLAGAAHWQLEAAPERVEIRLIWYTEGKGTQDVEIVDRMSFERPQADETQGFRFRLPDGPYSFSGRLISLAWAIEAVAEPSGDAGRVEIVVSPSGSEVVLGDAGAAPAGAARPR